jgi:hypothetical protein
MYDIYDIYSNIIHVIYRIILIPYVPYLIFSTTRPITITHKNNYNWWNYISQIWKCQSNIHHFDTKNSMKLHKKNEITTYNKQNLTFCCKRGIQLYVESPNYMILINTGKLLMTMRYNRIILLRHPQSTDQTRSMVIPSCASSTSSSETSGSSTGSIFLVTDHYSTV